MEKRQFGYDVIEVDRFNIVEDDATLTIKNAVIAREIVHEYRDEMTYKPADELQKATFTAAKAWLTETHPWIGVVNDVSQIRGDVRNPRFKNKGIYTDLIFHKDKCSPLFLREVKDRERAQLSIGYFFNRDPTPGNFNGTHYDSVQRNLLIHHVAVIKDRARCPPPLCGIGVDEVGACVEKIAKALESELQRTVGGDPWEETENEIRQRVQDPGKFEGASFRSKSLPGTKGVRIIVACPKGKYDSDEKRCKVGMQLQAYRFSKDANWNMTKAKAWFKEQQQDAATIVAAVADQEETVEDVKQRIKELAQRRQEIYEILYPAIEGKEELQAELTVINAELNALEEVLAAKIKGDQEREEKRQAAKKRASRYGITVKKGGNLSPPKGYPKRPDQYGDPVNYRYPLDTKIHCGAALRYFAQPKNRKQYSRKEQLIIWERIVRGVLRLGLTHRYDKANPLDRGLPDSLKRRLPGYED